MYKTLYGFIYNKFYKEKAMQKKKNEICTIIKNDILDNAKSYFIVAIIFIVGIFLGVMLINQTEDKSEIKNYINTYIDETKSLQNENYFKELQKDIKNNIILVILIWFAGTTIIGIPIVLGVILFRGFCLGYTIASCVFTLGRIKALIFIGISILLQNIIFIPALMILGVSSIKLYKSIIKDRRKENIKISIIKHSLISIIILISLIISSVVKIGISYRLIINLIKYF